MTVSLLIFSTLMNSRVSASAGSTGSICRGFSHTSLLAGLCKTVLAAPRAPVLHGKKKANELFPPGIMCNVFINHL